MPGITADRIVNICDQCLYFALWCRGPLHCWPLSYLDGRTVTLSDNRNRTTRACACLATKQAHACRVYRKLSSPSANPSDKSLYMATDDLPKWLCSLDQLAIRVFCISFHDHGTRHQQDRSTSGIANRICLPLSGFFTQRA